MEERILEEVTVESFFVEVGEVERLYNSDRDLHLVLWRALHADGGGDGFLYPDFEIREIRLGKFRNPDVTVKKVGSLEYVYPTVYKKYPKDMWKAQGTSLFDRPGVFVGSKWQYFEIPAGTEIPAGLLIIRDDYNERFGATHYSIVPNEVMTLTKFKLLLDQLALNARKRKGEAVNG